MSIRKPQFRAILAISTDHFEGKLVKISCQTIVDANRKGCANTSILNMLSSEVEAEEDAFDISKDDDPNITMEPNIPIVGELQLVVEKNAFR